MCVHLVYNKKKLIKYLRGKWEQCYRKTTGTYSHVASKKGVAGRPDNLTLVIRAKHPGDMFAFHLFDVTWCRGNMNFFRKFLCRRTFLTCGHAYPDDRPWIDLQGVGVLTTPPITSYHPWKKKNQNWLSIFTP